MKKSPLVAVVVALSVEATVTLSIPANALPAYVRQMQESEMHADTWQVHWRRHWGHGYYGWRGWRGPHAPYYWPYRSYRRYYPYRPRYYVPYGYYRPYDFYQPYGYYPPYRYYNPYVYYPPSISIWLDF